MSGRRVIRIRRRGAEVAEPEPGEVVFRPIRASETPNISSAAQHVFTRGGDVHDALLRRDVHTVIYRGEHGGRVTVSQRDKTLIFVNYILPQGVNVDKRSAFSSTLKIDGERIELDGGQYTGYAYSASSKWEQCSDIFPGGANAVEPKYKSIKDDDGNILGLIDRNVIYIAFDLMHSRSNQDKLLAYLARRWDEQYGEAPNWPPTEPNKRRIAIDAENLEKIFAESLAIYMEDGKKGHTEEIKTLKRQSEEALKLYVKRHHEYLRRLSEISKPVPKEEVQRRVQVAIKNLQANPDVEMVHVVNEGKIIRVITKPLTGRDWSGKRRWVFFLPVQWRNPYSRQITVKCMDDGMTRLISFKHINVFGDDDSLCAGGLQRGISANMMTGDWDLAISILIKSFRESDSS